MVLTIRSGMVQKAAVFGCLLAGFAFADSWNTGATRVIYPTVATTKLGIGITAIPSGKWMVELKTNGLGVDTCWRALKLSQTASCTTNVTLNGNVKSSAKYFVLSNDTGSGFIFSTGTLSNSGPTAGIGTERMRILSSNGFVGIGCPSPSQMLEVGRADAVGVSSDGQIVIGKTNGSNSFRRFKIGLDANYNLSIGDYACTGQDVYTPYLTVNWTNGNVGIGTQAPGTFKLAVEGKIGAREVVVTQATPWPDFVFKNDYKLKPLEQVEKQIKEYKHLENIPTEAEVKKEGIAVGEMQAKLLQKLEEVTLYLIEMKKENNQLKNRLSTLEKKIR